MAAPWKWLSCLCWSECGKMKGSLPSYRCKPCACLLFCTISWGRKRPDASVFCGSPSNYASVKRCSNWIILSFLFSSFPHSAGPHQSHQHLPDARGHSGHVQNGRPQHAGRLHPLSCLWTLWHQVRRSHTQMFDGGVNYHDPANDTDDGADDSDDDNDAPPQGGDGSDVMWWHQPLRLPVWL